MSMSSLSHKSATATGWTFSVDNIMAYREAKGVVNYFVPPRVTIFDTASSQKSSENPRKSLESVESSSKRALESKVSLGSGLTSGEMEKSSMLRYEPVSLSRTASSVDKRRDAQVSRHHKGDTR